jgi:hypothetical protein
LDFLDVITWSKIKNQCRDVAHAFSYMIDLDYNTMEIKLIVVQWTIAGC